MHRFASRILVAALSRVLIAGLTGCAISTQRYRKQSQKRGNSGQRVDRAWADARRAPFDDRYGRHLGPFGCRTPICYALDQVGALLGADDLRATACQRLDQLPEAAAESDMLDLMTGGSGAIPALLYFHAQRPEREDLLARAVRAGGHLLVKAHQSDEGWAWSTMVGPQARRDDLLLGFSSRTAGIAWTLLELHAVVREATYREAAKQAFAYERRHFDAQQENWPDLRSPELFPTPRPPGPQFMAAWCHGAPGIALSRLRGYELMGCDQCREEAEVALRTTVCSLAPSQNDTFRSATVTPATPRRCCMGKRY